MGEVYRATDSVLERKVAVKLLSERYATDPEVRARFQREALAAARLSGTPHVITIFDVGEHEERPYLVMEYLVGGSVHDRLREGPVSTDQALDWLAQAGQALDRAHQEGVVHRDVKPANLLLDREGKISVTDFGIASTSGMDTLTLPGTVLGTAGYLSPEQARGEPATAASDRYGLGVVAFELVTGRRPFVGETAATEAFAHVNAPIPSAEHLRPGLPDGVDEVLARALAKDPGDRPATCSELVSDLRDAFRGAVPAPTMFAGAPTQVLRTQPASTRRSTHRSGRRPPLRLLLGAAGLLLAGLAAAVLLGVIWDDDPQRNARRPSGQTTQTTQPTPTTGTT
ncbi:MAG: serine/threonine-protein kinase, partial [Gaiellaceae bacterium]